MIIYRETGVVKSITKHVRDITEIIVEVAGKDYPAINFDKMTGSISPGDTVLLNTTALRLHLGTGGCHFVMANLASGNKEAEEGASGHIMKLRYTPSQIKVLSVEEQDSPYHELMSRTTSLEGTPVVCCSLHSMLPAAAAAVAAFDKHLKAAYVMTDGAALPLGFSKMVSLLAGEGLICGTVTVGHAFGGDIEAVSLFSGLLAAKAVLGAQVIIVAMGPGIVGTGTPFGFSGIEQAGIIHAVSALEGCPVAIPRISFRDSRSRHLGLSHHSRTTLGKATLVQAYVSLPFMEETKRKSILRQMEECGILSKHKIVLEDGGPGLDVLERAGIKVTTMGRSISEEQEFFLAASCGGAVAAKIASGVELSFWEGEKS